MNYIKNKIDYSIAVKCSAIALVVFEALLFPIIQLTPWHVSKIASYTAIALVAIFTLITVRGENKDHLIRIGIAFTLVADYFLVLSNDADLEGVIAFIAVQMCYFAYLFTKERGRAVRITNACSRVLLVAFLVIAAIIILGTDVDALSIVSVIYYANLVANVLFAFLLGREERLFAIGLLLFSMCDLCIGLETLFDSYLDSKALDFFYGKYLNLPWIFYQPSQTLIALHTAKDVLLQKSLSKKQSTI